MPRSQTQPPRRSNAASARYASAASVSGERFVGRHAELAVVDKLLSDLAAGRGGGLAICGEPGMGKTSLTIELEKRATELGFNVCIGRGAEFERELPFGVIIDALDWAVGEMDPEQFERCTPERIHELATVFPSLSQRQDLSMQRLKVERYLLHYAVQWLMEQMADERPLVLVLDDLQWADAASIELVASLLRWTTRRAILTVWVSRSGQPPTVLKSEVVRAARDRELIRLKLAPLSFTEAEELLGPAIERRVRRALYRQSGGNPFNLRELARSFVDNGGSVPKGPPVEIGDQRVPAAVAQAIADELAALSSSTQRFLHGAAVAWEPFDPAVAARAADMELRQALVALDEALERDLIRPADRAAAYGRYAGTRRFTFRHPIVRRAVYEQAGEAWRLDAHTRVAVAFAERRLPAALLAHHVAMSARVGDEEAIELLAQAANAAAPGAPVAAARWLTIALRLLPVGATAEQRLALLLPLATVLGVSGQLAESRDALDEALAIAPAQPAANRAQILASIMRLDHVTGGHRDSRRQLEEALTGFIGDNEASGTLRLELSVDRWLSGEWSEMAENARDGLAAARADDDPGLEALALTLLAEAEKELGSPERVERCVEQAAAIVDRLTDDELARRAEVFLWLGRIECSLGRHRASESHLGRGIRIVRTSGQELFFVPLITALGATQLALGQLAEASTTVGVALDASALLGEDSMRMLAHLLECEQTLVSGDLSGAIAAGEEAGLFAERARSAFGVSVARCLVGEALVEAQRWEEGRATICGDGNQSDLSLLPAGLRPRVCSVLATAEIGLGKLEDAEQWVRTAELTAQQLGLTAGLADAARARATLLFAQGAISAAVEHATMAADSYRNLERPIDAARCDVLAGRALALLGERHRALECLQRAYDELAAREVRHHRDEAARGLRDLGVRVSRKRRAGERVSGLDALSSRELEVAKLVARGHTNRQIAGELFVTPKTVESHLAHIFDKLGVESRSAVASAASHHAQTPVAGV
jgi:DNA-binding CsgD family transcriptional regulator/tetratricopeptide (TPR) repeat protein